MHIGHEEEKIVSGCSSYHVVQYRENSNESIKKPTRTNNHI